MRFASQYMCKVSAPVTDPPLREFSATNSRVDLLGDEPTGLSLRGILVMISNDPDDTRILSNTITTQVHFLNKKKNFTYR